MSSATNKRHRNTDASAPNAAAPNPPAPKKAKKGKKAANPAPDASQSTTPALSPAEALTAAIAGAKKARTKRPNAKEKKAAFLAKFGGMSPEQILDTISSTWRSDVYDHFHPPKIAIVRGKVLHAFVCKRDSSKVLHRAEYEDSTGNLGRHVDVCDPVPTAQTDMIEAYASGVTYSRAKFRYTTAMWCARRHRPFTIVEDPEFEILCRMLYNKVEIPSRFTVSHDVHTILAFTKVAVIKLFMDHDGKISITLDGWTAPNVYAFLGITAHWHHEGSIRVIILDFVKLTKSHTGKYLAEKLLECLREYGIENKILGVTCDNAENNTTMMQEVEKLAPTIRGPRVRVRCLDHILNLVVKAILSQFKKKRVPSKDKTAEALADDDDEDLEAQRELDEILADTEDVDIGDIGDVDADEDPDDDDADPDREAADEELLDELDNMPEVNVTRGELCRGQLALEKILTLASKVWFSPTVREELGKLASAAGLNATVLVRPVKTRWNTVTEVLARAREMRAVLDDLCDMAQFNAKGKKGMRLRRYILSDEEWTIIDQLHSVLDAFLHATHEMSHNTKALVHEVIPYMDVLTEFLDRTADRADLLPIVRAAAQRGRAILDKYYSRTDDSIIFRIAMVLHPAYKFDYFRKHKWPATWIKVVEDLVREEWETYYKPKPVASADSGPSSTSQQRPGHRSAQTTAAASSSSSTTRSLFASIHERSDAAAYDALDNYLNTPINAAIQDPLPHWNAFLKGSLDAPLARMALDYLTVQATSSEAERAFSRGRLTVSRLRHSLSDSSVRASTVLGSWARIPDLVPQGEILASLDPSEAAKDVTDPEVTVISDDDDIGEDEEGVEIPPTSGTEDLTSEAGSVFD